MLFCRRTFFPLVMLLFSLSALAAEPKVVVLATGGTIAGTSHGANDGSYTAAKLPIEDLLAAVPETRQLAQLSGEQVAQVCSQAMTVDIWLTLARKVEHYLQDDGVDGVVITHGTDTMKETAYFLNLVLPSNKPVVLVGAMRSASSLSADGPLNLYNAIAVAASPKARGKGVMVVMNETIHSAREVTKTHTTAVNTFASRGIGPLGSVSYGEVKFNCEPVGRHTINSQFDIRSIQQLPEVDILYGYVSPSAIPLQALVEAGIRGIVYAGVGNGNLFPSVESALAEAVRGGVTIVRSAHTPSGEVHRNFEVDDDK